MWIIIIALLLIGLGLIVMELVFIPGTTVVGVLGVIFAAAGIVIAYKHFGRETGFYILLGASATTLATLVYSFRSGAWSKFSLKGAINSKVNEGLTSTLSVGDEGITLSALRPIGKAEINNKQYEVRTNGGYVENGKRIRIVSIQANQIFVEPIN